MGLNFMMADSALDPNRKRVLLYERSYCNPDKDFGLQLPLNRCRIADTNSSAENLRVRSVRQDLGKAEPYPWHPLESQGIDKLNNNNG